MLGMSTKQLSEKPPDCCEDDSFADLKPSTRGAGACWDSVPGQRHCQAPLLHSPSTRTAPVVHSTTAFSCGPTKAGRCTPALHFPAAALKLLVTHAPPGRCSLIIWLWWPRGPAFPSQEWQATIPRALHRLKHTPSLSVKKAYLLVL